MKESRIQKIIANAGLCSRRKAEILIIENRVKVNGRIANLGDKANPLLDEISLDNNKVINRSKPKVILLNKPKGYICSNSDPIGRKTVFSLIPKEMRTGIHLVGRLDLNSRGALLMTNNGDLTLKLTHPRFEHKKTYIIYIEGHPSAEILKKWEQGLILDGQKTKKCIVRLLKRTKKNTQIKIILEEGRNRQIRRIADQLGFRVIDLKRTAIAHINLHNLREGRWKEIEFSEWIKLVD